ncbi:hypothetical protein [Streptomyces sp. ISL-86]|uniref:hypothetical protein n=1 Tax=Streptomyces sp. ISL-86 TaxID=2819187 RepID=UPI001BE6C4ED|nr:hypothetical protein [Streptomyces sp. ISL-86]MBT2454850.1 hypothetical protein [Streptomyces sp. ISL-86]
MSSRTPPVRHPYRRCVFCSGTALFGLAGGLAENADGAAYADAVSEYAALGRDELREVARAVMGGYFGSWLNFAVDQK